MLFVFVFKENGNIILGYFSIITNFVFEMVDWLFLFI